MILPILKLSQISSYSNKFWFVNNLFHKSSIIQKHKVSKIPTTSSKANVLIKPEKLRKLPEITWELITLLLHFQVQGGEE